MDHLLVSWRFLVYIKPSASFFLNYYNLPKYILSFLLTNYFTNYF